MTISKVLHVRIYSSSIDLANDAAKRVVAIADECRLRGSPLVLGLAAGKSPMGIYRALAVQVRIGRLDLSNCIAFGLDEYYPVTNATSQRFSVQLTHIALSLGMNMQNLHLLRGDTVREKIETHCSRFEKSIESAGGIDLQILGIGQSGHIAFNEPGADPGSRTRRVDLAAATRKNVETAFGATAHSPTEAITMGIATILEAKEIALVALGAVKSDIVKKMLESPPSKTVPASLLQTHPNTTVYLDNAAAQFVNTENPEVSLHPFHTRQPGYRET